MFPSLIGLAAAVLAVISALTLYPSQEMAEKMAPVLMVAMGLLYLVSGLIFVIKPLLFRDAIRSFTRAGVIRTLGVITMLVGAALFRAAKHTDLPLFAQVFGVLAFVEGGVQLLLPSVTITMMEWWLEWSTTAYRVLGAAAVVLAALFLAAAGYFNLRPEEEPAPPAAVSDEAPPAPAPATEPLAPTPPAPAPPPTAPAPASPAS